jgi:hypothetical protein
LPILFIFYNTDLVKICNLPILLASENSIMEYVNILALGKSVEKNCRMLQTVHKRGLEWARRHGKFLPQRYVFSFPKHAMA